MQPNLCHTLICVTPLQGVPGSATRYYVPYVKMQTHLESIAYACAEILEKNRYEKSPEGSLFRTAICVGKLRVSSLLYQYHQVLNLECDQSKLTPTFCQPWARNNTTNCLDASIKQSTIVQLDLYDALTVQTKDFDFIACMMATRY